MSRLDADDIRTVITKHSGIPEKKLTMDKRLFSTGDIDSFAMVDILALVERSIGRKLDKNKLKRSQFDTIRRILDLAENPPK